MTNPLLRLIRIATVAAIVLAGAPALATSMFYGEVKTSNQFPIRPLADIRATLDIEADGRYTIEDILDGGSLSYGDGIGDGRIPVTIHHVFEPTHVTSIDYAYLTVGVRGLDRRETLEFDINGTEWDASRRRALWYSFFGGDVTAVLLTGEDKLEVGVFGKSGVVDVSGLFVGYQGGGTQAVPEPTGLALFCVGAVVLRRATRRTP